MSLVGHDDVLLLHESPAPPQHAVRAQRPRALIGRAILLSAWHIEAGRSRGQPQTLGDRVRDLQGARASSLRQPGPGRGARPPPGFGLRERQGGLDVCLSTPTADGWRAGCKGEGEGLF